MQPLTRQLISLDMLCTELTELALKRNAENQVNLLAYLRVLKQVCLALKQLNTSATDYTQYRFAELVASSGVALPINNKRLLKVYLRLSEYVIEYYQASAKIAEIRDILFDCNAEKRLYLLQVRAIKAKAQFKTVVQALGKRDYQQFALHLALPSPEWSWDALRIENE